MAHHRILFLILKGSGPNYNSKKRQLGSHSQDMGEFV